MGFRKKVELETGHEVVLHWSWPGECYEVVEIELWRGELWLGRLVRHSPGKYVLSSLTTPRDREVVGEAVEYYTAKHPDLVGKDWRVVIEQGLAREVDFGPLLDRANETGKAVTPCYKDCPYLAVDAEGRIYTWGNNPRDVYNSAVNKGWKGWFSQNRADEETLLVVSMNKVRVHPL